MTFHRMAVAILPVLFPVSHSVAGDSAPLTFDVRKNGTRDYRLDWGVQLAEAVPVKTGVSLGVVASANGKIEAVPVGVTARLGGMVAPGEAATIRRSLELNMAPSAGTRLTARASRPLRLAPNLDAELRGAIATGFKADGAELQKTVNANQQLWISGILPRTTVVATTSMASDQKGVAAALRIERGFAKGISVSAELSGGATTNSAGVSARYNWNW